MRLVTWLFRAQLRKISWPVENLRVPCAGTHRWTIAHLFPPIGVSRPYGPPCSRRFFDGGQLIVDRHVDPAAVRRGNCVMPVVRIALVVSGSNSEPTTFAERNLFANFDSLLILRNIHLGHNVTVDDDLEVLNGVARTIGNENLAARCIVLIVMLLSTIGTERPRRFDIRLL